MGRLIGALIIIVVSYSFGRYFGRTAAKWLARHKVQMRHPRLLQGSFSLIFTTIGILFALNLLGFQQALIGLAASGGITALVIGFAFKDVGENILAGLLLATGRPFDEGDTIRCGDFEGRVLEIGLRNTSIRAYDGVRTYVPNATILNSPLSNLTRSEPRRYEVTLGVDYHTNVARALEIIKNVVDSEADLLGEPAPVLYIKALSEQFITLSILVWIDSRDAQRPVLEVRTSLMARIKDALLKEGITLSSDVSSALAVTMTNSSPT